MSNKKIPEQLEITSSGWDDYELLDSGNSRKLERFGSVRLTRFEPQAVWKTALPFSEWQLSDAVFNLEKGKPSGNWISKNDAPHKWKIGLLGLDVELRIQTSRHIGIFPEQINSWLWIEKKIQSAAQKPRILNLFGYTGIASLFAARAGADVTHLDASRSSVKWAQHNQYQSGLSSLSIRWIVDDAIKFVEREARRGSEYDGLILDPPKFGRGPGGEVWKFDNSVPELLNACAEILSPNPQFIYLTAYDIEKKPHELSDWIDQLMRPYHGRIESGWLVQQEKSAGRKIRQSMFVRWSDENK